MSYDSHQTERLARPHNPWQFTPRAFFGAAVLLSLFYSAATMLEDDVQVAAIAGLAWLTLGVVYHHFRAIGSLVALGLGTGVLWVIWGTYFTESLFPGDWPSWEPEYVYGLAAGGFVWGCLFSILMTIVAAVESRVTPRFNWTPRTLATARPIEPSLYFPSLGIRLAVGLVVAHSILITGALLLLLAAALTDYQEELGSLASSLVVLIDLPVAPFVLVTQPENQLALWLLPTGLHALPLELEFGIEYYTEDISEHFWAVLAGGIWGSPLYGVMGWGVGYLVDVIRGRLDGTCPFDRTKADRFSV